MSTSPMKWRKLGRLFCANGQTSWMQTHSAVPFADHLFGHVYRVYFTTRDENCRSHTGYIDIDILAPFNLIRISANPVLAPGSLGAFDDSGAMGSWLIVYNNKRYLYFQGWNLGVTVPFRNSIGLAISEDGEDFYRYSPGPILDRSMFEPHFTATPCVIIENNIWKMWYLSCTEWVIDKGLPKHKYHIKYAESKDGINWIRDGKVAIDYANNDEYAISRPSVIRDKDCWRMWYSYRGEAYRIGYAESLDGINWERHDDRAGIEMSDTGWDSEMIEYPFVFDHNGQRYMLYNGNGYGKTGFGLAVLSNV